MHIHILKFAFQKKTYTKISFSLNRRKWDLDQDFQVASRDPEYPNTSYVHIYNIKEVQKIVGFYLLEKLFTFLTELAHISLGKFEWIYQQTFLDNQKQSSRHI